MGEPLILLLALGLDAGVGDPDWLWRRVPHPVVLFGAMIDAADRRLNRDADTPERRRRAGRFGLAMLLATVVLGGALLSVSLNLIGTVGSMAEAVGVAMLIAQRSLAQHVRAVATALRSGGIADARNAVAMIVGRNPETLNAAGVCRAAIESLAENFADGVVAPAFWYAALGLPGILAYKLINTGDSMIGHLSERHRDFGRATARLDDLANMIPARIAALLIALASGRPRSVLSRTLVDAPRHRSPNAGWPETAMAGALNVALGGPRSYGNTTLSEPILNASGRRTCDADDIDAAIAIYWRACLLMAVPAAAWALA